jgi:cytochrome P450
MNFPVLDRLPFPSRIRARQVVNMFKQELRRALVQSHEHSPMIHPTASPGGLGQRMLDATECGQWNDKQLLDNLTVAFVAGQENPQLCLVSTLYLLAKHPVSAIKRSLDSSSKTEAGMVDRLSRRMHKPSSTPRFNARDSAMITRTRKSCRTCHS